MLFLCYSSPPNPQEPDMVYHKVAEVHRGIATSEVLPYLNKYDMGGYTFCSTGELSGGIRNLYT